MTKPKIIATIECDADLRFDVCGMRLGHEYEVTPIEKCLKCEYVRITYTNRGAVLKNRLIAQAESWERLVAD